MGLCTSWLLPGPGGGCAVLSTAEQPFVTTQPQHVTLPLQEGTAPSSCCAPHRDTQC